MEYNIGIEMRSEYKHLELVKAAMTLVRDVMLAKSGETVLLTVDTATDLRLTDAVMDAAYIIGAVPILVKHPMQKEAFTQPPPPVASAIVDSNIWIDFAYNTTQHSDAYRAALNNGVRHTCLTGMDVEMIVNTIGNVDVETVIEFGEYLVSALDKTDKIVIKSPAGTDLQAFKKKRFVKHSGQKALKNGCSVMLCGQVTVCPIEETIEGTLVFDGALFPPAEIGVLNDKVVLTIKRGRITNIEGGPQAQLFVNWMASWDDENMYRLAHYSIGFNPGVTKPTGRIVEDERIFGTIEFGFGSQGKTLGGAFWNAASHTDGVVMAPTIIFDDKVFSKDGIYQDEKAREFCKKLGLAGY